MTAAIRKVHDFITVGAAAPLQEAGAVALQFPPSYYETLARDYTVRRDRLLASSRTPVSTASSRAAPTTS